jgi:uncharacterized protein YndB with AHSA1/START domain
MKEQFKITINAPRKKVWETLWGETTYPKWTAPFCEGSTGYYRLAGRQQGFIYRW